MKYGTITFRKSTTKGKLKTHVVDIQPVLAELLADYQPTPGALFPSLRGVTERLTRFASDKILTDAYKILMKKKILILSVNPRNTNKQRVDEEVRKIRVALERAQNREAFELIIRKAAGILSNLKVPRQGISC